MKAIPRDDDYEGRIANLKATLRGCRFYASRHALVGHLVNPDKAWEALECDPAAQVIDNGAGRYTVLMFSGAWFALRP